MRGFHKVLRFSSLTGYDYSIFPSTTCTKLSKMYKIYETKFGEVCLSINPHHACGGSGKTSEAWDDIYDDDDETFSASLGRGVGPSVLLSLNSLHTLTALLLVHPCERHAATHRLQFAGRPLHPAQHSSFTRTAVQYIRTRTTTPFIPIFLYFGHFSEKNTRLNPKKF
jgi:hypothetical protein